MVEQHYRWDFIGLSTDDKPTPATSEKVVDGSTFYCSDTSKLYVYCEDDWYERKPLGGGGGGTTYTAGNGIDITEDVISVDTTTIQPKLTAGSNITISDDTISATDTTYSAGTGLTLSGTEFSADTTVLATQNDLTGKQNTLTAGSNITISGDTISATDTTYSNFTGTDGTAAGTAGLVPAPATTDAGKFLKADGTWETALTQSSIVDNLTSTSTTSALSANQGKVLKDLVDSLAFKNAGAPTTATVGTVGQLLEDTTNGKLYICTAADTVTPTYTWVEVGAGGGGSGVTELTSADYDYPTNNPTSVALWKLDEGVYTAKAGVAVAPSTNTTNWHPTTDKVLVIARETTYTTSTMFAAGIVEAVTVMTSGGSFIESYSLLKSTLVSQSTGTSQTQIMSQNAVTSMVFADPGTDSKIRIGASGGGTLGASATSVGYQTQATGGGAVTLGAYSHANASSAVALGSYSETTTAGVIEVGLTSSLAGNWGYNSSKYRLLTGLYDPQSAHDAATKGYVDPTTDSSAPTTATVGRLGQIQIDTTNADAYMCVAVDSVTPSYTWKKINV